MDHRVVDTLGSVFSTYLVRLGYPLVLFFVFAWACSANLLAEHKFMTRGAWNFMEQSETQKAVNGALNLL